MLRPDVSALCYNVVALSCLIIVLKCSLLVVRALSNFNRHLRMPQDDSQTHAASQKLRSSLLHSPFRIVCLTPTI
ncbi:hypothetical protein BDW22DRAFT_940095 [Trametopsis cervina]|nr:hypothetical protein BDW22DRAFT_940095 [Trametopsis cervina]